VIEPKEGTMKIEYARAKKWKAGLLGAMAGLALVAGTLLAMGAAPTKHPTSFVEAVKPEVAASATSDRISAREAIADRDSLDLQLD
jgi:hypothetical protein